MTGKVARWVIRLLWRFLNGCEMRLRGRVEATSATSHGRRQLSETGRQWPGLQLTRRWSLPILEPGDDAYDADAGTAA
jgi:hypothetical protein